MANSLKKIILLFMGLSLAMFVHAVNVKLYFYSDGEIIATKEVAAGSKNVSLATTLGMSDTYMNSNHACRGYQFYGWKVGSPITSDEDPASACSSSVDVDGVMILHAVWYKASGSTSFVRITSTDDLHAGDKYLIVCHYMYGGYNQYYAMSNVSGQYTYNSTNYYKLDAFRLFPSGGVINAPDDYLVWTLGANSGDWVLRPSLEGTKSLYVADNASNALLNTSNNRCTISENNGVFAIKNYSSNRYLSYVSDEITETDDYFITATSPNNDYPIYMYRQASAYTSYPGCSAWTVHLDAGDGTFSGPADLTEVPAGNGVSLPSASISCGSGVTWTFAGWHSETPLEGTTTRPTLHDDGHYDPTFNGEKLYAVYKNATIDYWYERIDSRDEITPDGIYVIATTGGQAVKATIQNTNYFAKEGITVSADGKITSAVGSNIEWTFDGTRFKNGSTYLSYSGGTSNYYYVPTTDTESPFVLLNSSSPSRSLQETSYKSGKTTYYVFGRVNSTAQNFYIYKRKYTTYTSTPHCTPYSVKLHGCGGVIQVGSKTKTDTIYWETSAGGGITLPDVKPTCPTGNWSFVGWFVGDDLAAMEDVEFTDFKPQGSTYVPDEDGENLYAIFKRDINKFRVVSYPDNMVPDETYVFAYYGDGNYNWELTSRAYDEVNTTLAALQGTAAQDAKGYYISIPGGGVDSAALWRLGGSTDAWTFYSIKNQAYLNVNTGNGALSIGTATNFYVERPNNSFLNLRIYCTDNYYYYYGIYHNGTCFTTDDEYYRTACLLYRQMREYTSWPHCDGFTVFFEECGGTTGEKEVSEQNAYQGITLPKAYAPSDCSKEGWTFAGWATAPYDESTGALLTDLLPADMLYHPLKDSLRLYAVYCDKTHEYKKINSLSEMKLGVNYIIATNTNYALGNLPYNTNYIESVGPLSPESNIITSDNPAIEWRLQGVSGQNVWYNPARGTTGRYLDLRSPGYALMTTTIEDDFMITYSSDRFIMRSNWNRSDYAGEKYLGFNDANQYFNTVADGSQPTIYLYQQQATYWSFPNCVEPVDVVKWEKNDEGNFMYLESFTLKGELIVSGSLATTRQDDGTYKVQYNPAVLTECSKADIMWGEKSAQVNIPYIVSANTNLTTLLDGRGDCSTCDVYVMPDKTLTIDGDKTLHTVTVPADATLSFDHTEARTLTVNSLVLNAEGDTKAPEVNLSTNGSIVLKNDELYFDLRIPNDRYYWLTLPYNSQLQEISYSNVAANGGTPPVYFTDYYMYYYNGALRAADANGGEKDPNGYWYPVAGAGHDYTMRAGQGYLLGVDDGAVGEFNTQGYEHAKRVIRFTMRPPLANDAWLEQERGSAGSKLTTIVPSTCVNPKNHVHAGWNLIGNPYLHSYTAGEPIGNSYLKNGKWVEVTNVNDDWYGYYRIDESDEDTHPWDVPYFTVFTPSGTSGTYEQYLVSSYRALRPFEAVFIQSNSGTQINFTTPMSIASGMPAYMRAQQKDLPVRTGIILSGNDRVDRTGFVLYEEYTDRYEIGADLQKISNAGKLNLYSFNADDHQLAFNGLSEENAISPIPLGVTFPQGGEYTFEFDAEQYDYNAIDTLMIIDKSTGVSKNLKYTNYTFTTNAGTVNNRFEILIRLAKEVITDIEPTMEVSDHPRKVIMNGQLFILKDDEMYNATGVRVK